MHLIGLTGGISTGKSTGEPYPHENRKLNIPVTCQSEARVTWFLRDLGITVIDCDEIAHAVCEKGRWGYRRVVKAFGPRVLTAEGRIDRDAVAKLIFNDVKARQRLNHATHVPIAFEIIWQILTHWLMFTPIVILDMPLLFETGSNRMMSKSIVVSCEPNQQLERLIIRDSISMDDAASRILAQMDLSRKQAMADIIIENDGSLSTLKDKVAGVAQLIKGEATRGGIWLLTSPLLPVGVIAAIAILRLAYL